jgi:hypothetical protein
MFGRFERRPDAEDEVDRRLIKCALGTALCPPGIMGRRAAGRNSRQQRRITRNGDPPCATGRAPQFGARQQPQRATADQ